jgi:hypothetical protein
MFTLLYFSLPLMTLAAPTRQVCSTFQVPPDFIASAFPDFTNITFADSSDTSSFHAVGRSDLLLPLSANRSFLEGKKFCLRMSSLMFSITKENVKSVSLFLAKHHPQIQTIFLDVTQDSQTSLFIQPNGFSVPEIMNGALMTLPTSLATNSCLTFTFTNSSFQALPCKTRLPTVCSLPKATAASTRRTRFLASLQRQFSSLYDRQPVQTFLANLTSANNTYHCNITVARDLPEILPFTSFANTSTWSAETFLDSIALIDENINGLEEFLQPFSSFRRCNDSAFYQFCITVPFQPFQPINIIKSNDTTLSDLNDGLSVDSDFYDFSLVDIILAFATLLAAVIATISACRQIRTPAAQPVPTREPTQRIHMVRFEEPELDPSDSSSSCDSPTSESRF